MNEKQLTIEALEHIIRAVESMNSKIEHMEYFLLQNFRNYDGRYNNVSYHLPSIMGAVNDLKKITATNADHVGKLEQTEEPQSNISYVVGDYPQNHSIQQAKQRIAEHQQSTGFEPVTSYQSGYRADTSAF